MTYQTGSTIEAKDFNLFLTGTDDGSYVEHSVSNLSSLLTEGYGKFGYGSSLTLTPKEYGDKVTASDWNQVLSLISKCATEQGTTILPMTGTISGISYPAPAVGIKVKALPNILANLNSLMSKSLNHISQGQTTVYDPVYSSAWKRQVALTYVVEFESADKARYFFNRGGQIKLDPYHPASGTGDTLKINTLFNNLSNACGTIFLSSPVQNSTADIKDVSYSGITRIGSGLPTPAVYLTSKGWYELTTTQDVVFAINGSNLPSSQRLSGYNSSGIKIEMNTNGAQTINGDVGNQLTIVVTFYENPDAGKSNLIASAGSRCKLTVIEPSTTRFSDSWGLVTVTSSMVGS